MNSTTVIRVVIVDDDALMPQLFARILASAQIEVVHVANDGDQVVDVVKEYRPDVVLMDLRMERVDGIAATRQVMQLSSPPGVIALTSFDTDTAIVDAVEAGAAGFLAKTSGPEEIIEAVKHVAAGEGALSPRAARVVMEQMRSSSDLTLRKQCSDRLARLSDREREVALAIAAGRTNAEIAGELYLAETTVKTHINAILEKIKADNRVQVASIVAAAGLITSL
ncbi:two component transcriptional regulator, LuxR family [Micrococcales bacterium KH10]|nr:two component transcriptional regulator, LuxR family [Micrococcales bacterium KH10]